MKRFYHYLYIVFVDPSPIHTCGPKISSWPSNSTCWRIPYTYTMYNTLYFCSRYVRQSHAMYFKLKDIVTFDFIIFFILLNIVHHACYYYPFFGESNWRPISQKSTCLIVISTSNLHHNKQYTYNFFILQ